MLFVLGENTSGHNKFTGDIWYTSDHDHCLWLFYMEAK